MKRQRSYFCLLTRGLSENVGNVPCPRFQGNILAHSSIPMNFLMPESSGHILLEIDTQLSNRLPPKIGHILGWEERSNHTSIYKATSPQELVCQCYHLFGANAVMRVHYYGANPPRPESTGTHAVRSFRTWRALAQTDILLVISVITMSIVT